MKIILITIVICSSLIGQSQDLLYARKMVDTLTSKTFWGRGYTNNGMQLAANFLSEQMQQLGLKPMNKKKYLQEYSYSVNTFPDEMSVNINGTKLKAGVDYIVSAESIGSKTWGVLEEIDSVTFCDKIVRVIIELKDKLTMTVAQRVENYTIVQIDKKSLPSKPVNYKIDIENKFIQNFKANNICGFVKGTQQPDSFIIITAHYDHLGGLGKDVYFPGANDNASGVSLLLNLAAYYAKNPQPFSIGFILFSGEEAGLLGSKYFTEHPLINLKNIRFLLNTDLAGTGIEGITVVNATEFKKEFEWMQEINKSHNLFVAVNPRGKAHNSDHYYFTEQGVPSFFFYTLGGIKAYHDVFDKAETLPLTKHTELFKLVVEFNKKIMGIAL